MTDKEFQSCIFWTWTCVTFCVGLWETLNLDFWLFVNNLFFIFLIFFQFSIITRCNKTFYNFLTIFENFLTTCWQFSDNFLTNFLTTFCQLFDKFFDKLYDNFLTNFWQLFYNLGKLFDNLLTNFLTTFWLCYSIYVTGQLEASLSILNVTCQQIQKMNLPNEKYNT
jgi:hypothetical protein